MRKSVALIVSILLMLTACTPAASTVSSAPPASSTVSAATSVAKPAGSGDLIIFTWADYIAEDVVKAFEAETGVTVKFSYFDKNEDMLTKLGASNGAGYDLVLASDYIIAESAAQGLVQDLDYSKIPNAKDIDPSYQSHFYDPENKYTIPFAAGTPLIIYDPAKVDIEITGYESLWDPSLKDAVVVFDDARLMVGFTMKMLGGSLNSTDPELIQAAEEKLYELKPNILAFDYDTSYEKMISGEAKAGLMFTSQIVWAMDARPDLETAYPVEGMGFGIDSFFIPSKAANVDNAHLFLNYVLRGEVAAELSQYAGYINCVTTSKEYLPKEVLDNKVLYIPKDILGEAEFMQNINDQATELINDAWVKVKQK